MQIINAPKEGWRVVPFIKTILKPVEKYSYTLGFLRYDQEYWESKVVESYFINAAIKIVELGEAMEISTIQSNYEEHRHMILKNTRFSDTIGYIATIGPGAVISKRLLILPDELEVQLSIIMRI